MIDEERKDEAGMSQTRSPSVVPSRRLNPTTDHMAAATRQRLHLSQRGKKKPTAHSKETRLPAQQLKARKANDGVKEMNEEEGKVGAAAASLVKPAADAVSRATGLDTHVKAGKAAYNAGKKAGENLSKLPKIFSKKDPLGEEELLAP